MSFLGLGRRRLPETSVELPEFVAGLAATLPTTTAAVEAVVMRVAPTPMKVTAPLDAGEAPPGWIRLYRDGVPVFVPAAEITRFAGLGFIPQEPGDYASLVSEIEQLAAQLGPALRGLVDQVQAANAIDTRANQQLHIAVTITRDLESKTRRLLDIICRSYPVLESEG